MSKQIAFNDEAYEELLDLSQLLGFSMEETARYAVRLVAACVREGLLTDVAPQLWPEEAQEGISALRCTGTQGKIIEFPGGK